MSGDAVVALSVDELGTLNVLASSPLPGSADLVLDANGYFISDSTGGLAQVYAQGGDSDPATATDPVLDAPIANTLGQEPAGLGGDVTNTTPQCPPLVCPLRLDLSTRRYFLYNGAITPLIGVSGDAACNLHLGNGFDMCTFSPRASSNYQRVLSDARAKGLNKIRLWVNINGGTLQSGTGCSAAPPDPADQPFKYYAPGSQGFPTGSAKPPDGIGYWNLDERNDAFFSNLQTVVNYASQQGLFVEVTFFAPWIGSWEISPWNPNHGRLSTDSTHTIHVGFSDRSYFVRLDPSNGGNNANEMLRQYQKAVIDWTIDALDAPPSGVNGGLPFDKVYFEIANEPENPHPSTACNDTSVPLGAAASFVVPWQKSMVDEVFLHDGSFVAPAGSLSYRHLIAVQPFTLSGTTPYLPGGSVPNVGVVNGHYTALTANAAGSGGLGAITMARTYANTPGVVFASNEGKISGQTTAFPWGGSGETCGWENPTRNYITGLPTGLAGVDCFGEAEGARAEAWEFMLYQGGAFDHFGYYWNSAFGASVRRQLGALRTFMTGLTLRQLMTSPDPVGGAGPSWVNIGASPYSNSSNLTKYWAALQPNSAATNYSYVLYIHHSRRHPGSLATNFASFGGYLPVFNADPSNPQYVENLSLCLATQSQHYRIQWVDPTSGAIRSETTVSGSGVCGSSAWRTQSPPYAYDIALKVTQVP